MNKKHIIVLSIIILLLIIIFIVLKFIFPNQSIFNYNLMEILTASVATFGIFFLTKANDDVRNRNKKIENVIELLRNKFNKVFNPPLKIDKQAEYLYTFKYIDNKIKVLEKLSSHLKCDQDIQDIKNEKQKLDEFINENLCHGEKYFIGETVKEKIPNILCNIETRLDNIIIKIYNN